MTTFNLGNVRNRASVCFSGVDLAIIVFYFGLVLVIGFYLKRFANTGEDFSWLL